jgi:hypothetical protein
MDEGEISASGGTPHPVFAITEYHGKERSKDWRLSLVIAIYILRLGAAMAETGAEE